MVFLIEWHRIALSISVLASVATDTSTQFQLHPVDITNDLVTAGCSIWQRLDFSYWHQGLFHQIETDYEYALAQYTSLSLYRCIGDGSSNQVVGGSTGFSL